MAKVRTNPLGDKHLKTVNEIIQRCSETEEYCKLCSDCHLNVDPERAKNAEQLKIAQAIKRVFFPHAK